MYDVPAWSSAADRRPQRLTEVSAGQCRDDDVAASSGGATAGDDGGAGDDERPGGARQTATAAGGGGLDGCDAAFVDDRTDIVAQQEQWTVVVSQCVGYRLEIMKSLHSHSYNSARVRIDPLHTFTVAYVVLPPCHELGRVLVDEVASAYH